MATHVWLANPSSGDLWECPNDESVLAFYLARGWTHSGGPVEDGEDVVPAPEPAPKPTPKKRSTN